jgi:hypothetical protein
MIAWLRRRRPTTGAFVVGALLLLVVLQLARQRGVHPWDTLWAEDGAVYLSGADRVQSLLHTYSGYLQFVPRLVAFAATAVPVRQASRFYAIASALVTAVCAIGVYVLADGLVRARVLRAVLALAVIALPSVLVENLATAANLTWPLLFVNFWALLAFPRTTRRTVLAAGLAALSALTSVLALVYVPFAAMLAWKRRDHLSRIVVSVFAAAAMAQLLLVLTAANEGPHATTRAGDLPGLYVVRVLSVGLLGERGVHYEWRSLGYGLGVVAAIVVAVVAGLLLSRTSGARRCLGTVTIGYSVLMYVVAVAIRGTTAFSLQAAQYFPNGTRFSALSLWLLLSGIAILLDGVACSEAVRRLAIAVFVAQFAVVGLLGFRGTNARSGGPAWSAAVDEAASSCRDRPGDEVVVLPITPAGWTVSLTCDQVTDS